MYVPHIGTFVQRDPLPQGGPLLVYSDEAVTELRRRMSGEEVINLYAYVSGNPVNSSAPSGLKKKDGGACLSDVWCACGVAFTAHRVSASLTCLLILLPPSANQPGTLLCLSVVNGLNTPFAALCLLLGLMDCMKKFPSAPPPPPAPIPPPTPIDPNDAARGLCRAYCAATLGPNAPNQEFQDCFDDCMISGPPT